MQQKLNTSFHPTVVGVLIALAAIFVFCAWGFLAGGGYVTWVAVIVSFFFIVVLSIPFGLWRIRSRHRLGRQPAGSGEGFRQWLHEDMDVFGDRLEGRVAMVTALIPIAAAALAAVAIAVVFQVVTRTTA